MDIFLLGGLGPFVRKGQTHYLWRRAGVQARSTLTPVSQVVNLCALDVSPAPPLVLGDWGPPSGQPSGSVSQTSAHCPHDLGKAMSPHSDSVSSSVK